jgi:uncharacterized membrane protein YhaH (DUF805 family)
MEWMLRPLGRYFDFSGRSNRAELLWYALFISIVSLAAFFGDAILFGSRATADPPFTPILWTLLALTILPNLAVQVRRLHDTDRSGWWLLLSVLPIIGQLIVLIFELTPGSKGRNRFGEPPRIGVARPPPTVLTTAAVAADARPLSPTTAPPLEQLERLARLKEQGHLSNEEFDAQKAALLSASPSRPE